MNSGCTHNVTLFFKWMVICSWDDKRKWNDFYCTYHKAVHPFSNTRHTIHLCPLLALILSHWLQPDLPSPMSLPHKERPARGLKAIGCSMCQEIQIHIKMKSLSCCNLQPENERGRCGGNISCCENQHLLTSWFHLTNEFLNKQELYFNPVNHWSLTTYET